MNPHWLALTRTRPNGRVLDVVVKPSRLEAVRYLGENHQTTGQAHLQLADHLHCWHRGTSRNRLFLEVVSCDCTDGQHAEEVPS